MASVLAEACKEGDCEEDREVVGQAVVEGELWAPCTVRVGADEALPPPPAPPSPTQPAEREGVPLGLPAALLEAAEVAVLIGV